MILSIYTLAYTQQYMTSTIYTRTRKIATREYTDNILSTIYDIINIYPHTSNNISYQPHTPPYTQQYMISTPYARIEKILPTTYTSIHPTIYDINNIHLHTPNNI